MFFYFFYLLHFINISCSVKTNSELILIKMFNNVVSSLSSE